MGLCMPLMPFHCKASNALQMQRTQLGEPMHAIALHTSLAMQTSESEEPWRTKSVEIFCRHIISTLGLYITLVIVIQNPRPSTNSPPAQRIIQSTRGSRFLVTSAYNIVDCHLSPLTTPALPANGAGHPALGLGWPDPVSPGASTDRAMRPTQPSCCYSFVCGGFRQGAMRRLAGAPARMAGPPARPTYGAAPCAAAAAAAAAHHAHAHAFHISSNPSRTPKSAPQSPQDPYPVIKAEIERELDYGQRLQAAVFSGRTDALPELTTSLQSIDQSLRALEEAVASMMATPVKFGLLPAVARDRQVSNNHLIIS